MRATLTHDPARSAPSAFPPVRSRHEIPFRASSRRFAGRSVQCGRYFWAATDHLGSVREVLANNEAIVEHRDYTSFGALDAAYNALGKGPASDAVAKPWWSKPKGKKRSFPSSRSIPS